MRLLPCGSGALLAEYDTLAEVMAVDDVLRISDLPGIDDVIPAARTVLVAYHNVDRAALERLLSIEVDATQARRLAGGYGSRAYRPRPPWTTSTTTPLPGSTRT